MGEGRFDEAERGVEGGGMDSRYTMIEGRSGIIGVPVFEEGRGVARAWRKRRGMGGEEG